MSHSDDEHDDFHAHLAQSRLEGAEAFDAMPKTTHPRDILGDVVEELTRGADAGPIEFEGKEDYIRGATACLRGMDIVGCVPHQVGAALSTRLSLQNLPVGYTLKNQPGGKSFLSLVAPKPPPGKGGGIVRTAMTTYAGKNKPPSNETTVNKAKTVAKNARTVARSLKNFKSPPAKVPTSTKKPIVGDGIKRMMPGEAEIRAKLRRAR